MPLIDLEENDEMFKDIASNCKEKDGTEFVDREDSEWWRIVSKWSIVKAKLTAYQKEEAELRQQLIKECRGKNSQGCGVKVQRIIRKGSIDYKSIPALQGVNLDEYREMPIESWRITLDEQ